jgi:hypothetical protein
MKPIAGFAVLSSQGVSPTMKIVLAMLLLAGAAFAWSHDDWRYQLRRERTEVRQARSEMRRELRHARLRLRREIRDSFRDVLSRDSWR